MSGTQRGAAREEWARPGDSTSRTRWTLATAGACEARAHVSGASSWSLSEGSDVLAAAEPPDPGLPGAEVERGGGARRDSPLRGGGARAGAELGEAEAEAVAEAQAA